MRIRELGAIAGALLASAIALPAFAHHSFSAEFDDSHLISLDGIVTKMDFSIPHSWLHLEVTTASGEKQEWTIEGGAPNALVRCGWNRDTVQAGSKVHIEAYPAWDRSLRAGGRTITLANGQRLSMGSIALGPRENLTAAKSAGNASAVPGTQAPRN
jgi:hypothetical protein